METTSKKYMYDGRKVFSDSSVIKEHEAKAHAAGRKEAFEEVWGIINRDGYHGTWKWLRAQQDKDGEGE